MIELDVQLTLDEGLVVLHDLQLGRTVGAEGPVRGRRLDELCSLDAGSWFAPEYAGATVPSLDDVLDQTAGRVDLNVEIKSPEPDWPATARVLIGALETRQRLANTLITSFSFGALEAVRALSADARIGVLWHAVDLADAWVHAEAVVAESLNLLWRRVDDAVVSRAHEKGLKLFTWTVNGEGEIAKFAALGVDGIITDFPEQFPAGRVD